MKCTSLFDLLPLRLCPSSIRSQNLDQILLVRASALAARLWSPRNASIFDPSGAPHYTNVTIALLKHRCRLLRRGLRPAPLDSRDHFSRRSTWQQCELGLPPAAREQLQLQWPTTTTAAAALHAGL